MAGLDSVHTLSKIIHDQAQIQAATVISLNELFEAESVQLIRLEAIRCLKLIRTSVLEDLERARGLESAAEYARTQVDLGFSLTGLAAKLLTAELTDNQRTRNFVDEVFSTHTHYKPTFGTVMVCVGPKGLPGDVQVIAISELARESKRLESAVKNELRQEGRLLFSEETFCSLIDKLTELIREGHLVLPVPVDNLAALITPLRREWVAVRTS